VNGAVLWLALLGAAGADGGAGTAGTAARTAPIYPDCPPPFQRRSSAGIDAEDQMDPQGYVLDACGGFGDGGRVRDGWEVYHYQNGHWREVHWWRGKMHGPFRGGSAGGEWWVGTYVDHALEGVREYWHGNGMKEHEATRHRGFLDGLGRSWFPDGSLHSIWRAEGGTFKATLTWNEAGKLLDKVGDIASLTNGKTIEQLRSDNARPFYPKTERPKGPTGPLGAFLNPVRCDHLEGEWEYLQRLRCRDGKRPWFGRLGSFGSGIYGHIVDGYQVRCARKTQIIYMDLYFPDYRETAAVPGFTFGR
jgi:hypothetical protein